MLATGVLSLLLYTESMYFGSTKGVAVFECRPGVALNSTALISLLVYSGNVTIEGISIRSCFSYSPLISLIASEGPALVRTVVMTNNTLQNSCKLGDRLSQEANALVMISGEVHLWDFNFTGNTVNKLEQNANSALCVVSPILISFSGNCSIDHLLLDNNSLVTERSDLESNGILSLIRDQDYDGVAEFHVIDSNISSNTLTASREAMGGAFAVNANMEDKVTFERIVVSDNTLRCQEGRGGAIAVSMASVQVLNCSFRNNSIVTSVDHSFSNNPKYALGGALFLTDTLSAVVRGCNFTLNYLSLPSESADEGSFLVGGALGVLMCSNLELIECNFTLNSINASSDKMVGAIQAEGAALYMQFVDKANINHCRFANNTVTSSRKAFGGAASISGNFSRIQIANTLFEYNEAVVVLNLTTRTSYAAAGALMSLSQSANPLFGPPLLIKNCSFNSNNVTFITSDHQTGNKTPATLAGNALGGALAVDLVSIENTKFSSNAAKGLLGFGGAIHFFNPQPEPGTHIGPNVTFLSNEAHGIQMSGGGGLSFKVFAEILMLHDLNAHFVFAEHPRSAICYRYVAV